MSALAKIKHVSSFVRTVQTVNSPLLRACYCMTIQVNGAVRREGPDRQGSGSADSGRGEILGGNGEILILVMTGKWRNLFFRRRNLAAKFLLVLHTFEPPQNLPPTLHCKFHRVIGRNFLVCHSPVRERFREG